MSNPIRISFENCIKFIYTPNTGKILFDNQLSVYRGIEYLSKRGFEILWNKSNPSRQIIYVNEMTNVEGKLRVNMEVSKEVTLLSEAQFQKQLDEGILKDNIDNSNGKELRWNTLRSRLYGMKTNKDISISDVCDWCNHFNIEVKRPDKPLIKASTKSKSTIVDEAIIILKELFDKGQLVRYTEEEFNIKINKYTEVNNEQ